MAVLVDPPRWPAHGRLWSHLVSDTSFAELHAFAHALGIPPRAFEGDHYDLPADRYDEVIAGGARPVSGPELLRALQVSGLRRRKRRGERVIASIAEPDARVDSVLSALAPTAPVRVVHLIRHRHLVQDRHLIQHRGGEVWVQDGPGGLRVPQSVAAPSAPGAVRFGFLRWVGPDDAAMVAESVWRQEVSPGSDDAGSEVADADPSGVGGAWVDLAEARDQLRPPLAAFLAWLPPGHA